MTKPADPVFIRHLTPRNCLSFGPDNPGIELKALNIFIGPNGSGKSNLIETISLIRATAKQRMSDVTQYAGASTADWIWKGMPFGSASVDCVLFIPDNNAPLRHSIAFNAFHHAFVLGDERIEYTEKKKGAKDVYFFYRYNNGRPVVNTVDKKRRSLAREEIQIDRSILSQRRDPETYPEITNLAQRYENVRIYRDWVFGRQSALRQSANAVSQSDYLHEDFSNLASFLSRIMARFPQAKRSIIDGLKELYDGIEDFNVSSEGKSLQMIFTEGEFTIPAARLSDGTLRYLCLLAILCDPDPPPLICIEEPELGLHPDIIPKVADMLRAASLRTQLIVTTHSDILVDAMSETPEVVVVCSKEQGQTMMQRLDADDLAEWLKDYRLGQLWMKGQIGGTRW